MTRTSFRQFLAAALLCAIAVPSFGAITATAIFETQATSGNDSNGGCYVAADNGGTGTDLTYPTSSPHTFTASLSATGTTTLTDSGGGFVNTMVGNCIAVAGQGLFEIKTFTNTSNVVVDATLGTFSGATGVVGGALKTVAKACTTGYLAAGMTNYVKAEATYSVSAGTTCATGGTGASWIRILGYTSTRGDDGQATMQQSSAITTLTLSGGAYDLENFVLDCNSKAASVGLLASQYVLLRHVTITACGSRGINNTAGSVTLRNVVISGGLSGCTSGISSLTNLFITKSRITGNQCPGIIRATGGFLVMTDSIVDHNTGASSDGLQINVTSAGQTNYLRNNAFVANGRDGVRGTVTLAFTVTEIANNIFVSNVGNGITSTVDTYAWLNSDYNFFYGNGAAVSGVPAGPHDVTGTGDPFVASGSNDFRLNNTAGAGAAARAAADIGVMSSGGTGYLDIGPLQHQDSGSSTSTIGVPGN
jgi:hypothetical protein